MTDIALSTSIIELNVQSLTKALVYQLQISKSLDNSEKPGENSWRGPEHERLRKGLRTLFNQAKNSRTKEDWDIKNSILKQ